MSENDRFRPRQERALAALMSHATIAGAAEAAGVTERTMRRYLSDPDFSDEFKKRINSLVQEASNDLKKGAVSAVSTLVEVMRDSSAPPYSRVQAARVLLDQCAKFGDYAGLLNAASEKDVPTFIYMRQAPTEPTIPTEAYERVERFFKNAGAEL